MRHAPAIRIPLPFFIVGIVSWIAFAGLMVVRGSFIIENLLRNPWTLFVVHLFTLGVATSIVLGALLQLIPVVAQTELRKPRWARIAFWFHVVGLTLLLAGFAHWQPMLFATGGTLIFIGISLLTIPLLSTVRASKRNWEIHVYAVAAVVFLFVTVTWGITLALNLSWGFLPWSIPTNIGFHLLVGFGGWFSMLAIGISYRLIPMFSVSPEEGWHPEIVFGLTMVTLSALLVNAFWPQPVLFALAGLAGVGALGMYVADMTMILFVKRKRTLEAPLWSSALAIVDLVLALGLLLWGHYTGDGVFTIAGLLLFLFGWISGIIISQLYKIVPFITWMALYAPKMGKEPVPLMRDLVNEAADRWWFALYHLSVYAIVGAILVANYGWQPAFVGLGVATLGLLYRMVQLILPGAAELLRNQ